MHALPALWAAVPDPPADEVRRRLAEVLSRPEFTGVSESSWLEPFLEWLAGVFRWLGELQGTAPVVFWILLVSCVVLLLVLVAYIAWAVGRAFGGGARLPDEAKAAERRGRQSRIYLEEARRRAAEQEFTEAIRCLFLSLVYRFDESGRVSFHQANTNREYLALLTDRPPVHEQLRVFVDTLDDHWYGQRPTNRGRYEECLSLYQQMLPA